MAEDPVVDLAGAAADRLGRSPATDDRDAGAVLVGQLEAFDAGRPNERLRLQVLRTVSESDPDQEWAETTECVIVRIDPPAIELLSHRNLATMMGASQYDEVVLRGGGATGTVDDDAARWLAALDRVLADPSHRVFVSAERLPEPAAATPAPAVATDDPRGRVVVLRDERDGRDVRRLVAWVDEDGDLHIDGHDLGPGTEPVSADGEYEWFQTIRATDVPRLLAHLGDPAEADVSDVLDVLAERWCGAASYDLEAILHEGVVPVERHVI